MTVLGEETWKRITVYLHGRLLEYGIGHVTSGLGIGHWTGEYVARRLKIQKPNRKTVVTG